MSEDNAKIVEGILGDWGWADSEYEVIEEQDTHFYVLGLDPGETTGFAIVRIDTEDQKALPELVFLDQIPGGRDGFYDYFYQFFIGDNAAVASEIWKERNKKGVDREPQYIEGVIHALWNRHNVTWQEPAMKSLVPDEWLVEQNLWTPGKRHQMDALIHAIVYLRNDGHEGTVGALGGEGDETIAEPGEADEAQGDGSPADDGAQRGLAQFARERKDELEGHSVEGQEGYFEGDGSVEVKGKRKERELDGAFFGFESAEAESGEGEVSLLDD